MMQVDIFDSPEEVHAAAAEMVVRTADAAIAGTGRFTFVLSGGSTPKALYQLLASPDFRGRIDWGRTCLFFGDERCVAPDDQESNFRMASESILRPLGIDDGRIFRWRTELGPEDAAHDYESRLTSFFGGLPRFDLTLLGLGADGHTASLFPYSSALRETSRLAVANLVEKLRATRLTLTPRSLNASSNIAFLVIGGEKAGAVREVLEGGRDPLRLPAQAIRPVDGSLFWFLDRNVAKLLNRYAT